MTISLNLIINSYIIIYNLINIISVKGIEPLAIVYETTVLTT